MRGTALTHDDQDNTRGVSEGSFTKEHSINDSDETILSPEETPAHYHEDPTQAQVNGQPEQSSSFTTLFLYALIALGIALFVRFFIAAPYIVSGASMEPTFDSFNYLIIDRISYHLGDPPRGDVVVFHFPQDPSRSFIKRVIGLPHETVVIQSNQVFIQNDVHPEGFPLEEPYILSQNMRDTSITLELEEGEYFVMGDNRRASADSRVWGPVPRDNIVGRVLFRLYPLNQIGVLPGQARYSEE